MIFKLSITTSLLNNPAREKSLKNADENSNCQNRLRYLTIWFFGEDIVVLIKKLTDCSFISLVELDDRRKR